MNPDKALWVVARCTGSERGDLILRVDSGADTVVNTSRFVMRLGVAVPLLDASLFAVVAPLEG